MSSKYHSRRAGTGAGIGTSAAKDEVAVLAVSAHLTDRDRELVRRWLSKREVTEYLYLSTWDAERNPHPDGLGVWAEDGRDIVFFLEYDTGSLALARR